jgi:carbon starvation protein
VTASIAALFIIIVTLASVATVLINALSHSPWGMFTIIVTIPAALLTGFWMYTIRPGRVAEASVIGVSLVLLGVFLGKPFAESSWGAWLLFDKQTLALILPAYSLVASILPVWVLMCPRDYLSSYMKIGVIVVLAVGIFVAHPVLKMPATTVFIHGGGPVITGPVWPFLCIVVMCGAISGFHALVSSGTTPKMIDREGHIRTIGYGAMIVEGLVAITALVAACALEPGDYFAINSTEAAYAQVRESQGAKGWDLSPVELPVLERETQEKLAGRVGGAVTLAVGMAKVFSSLPFMQTLASYWYHFAIMFEALFILTLLETGTRVARFMFSEAAQELFSSSGNDGRPRGRLSRFLVSEHGKPNWWMNVGMSSVVCFLWGYLLYRGDLDTLWRMLGIVNQLLASTGLAVGTTYLLLHAPKRIYALCTAVPFVFLVVTTFVASVMSIDGWCSLIDGSKAKMAAPGLAAAALAALSKQVFLLQLVSVLATIMLVLVSLVFRSGKY